MTDTFALYGTFLWSRSSEEIAAAEKSFLICENGLSAGVFPVLPDKYKGLPVQDVSHCITIPGFSDLHLYAARYSVRGLGLDLPFHEWLSAYALPEEEKYSDLSYARKAYSLFVRDLRNSATARACIFATSHVPAAALLNDLLEKTGLKTIVIREGDAPCYTEEEERMGLPATPCGIYSGGSGLSVFRAMTNAIQISRLRQAEDPFLPSLSFPEAFYRATKGGGAVFGKAGSFEPGFEFDAVILNDHHLPYPHPLTPLQRLERLAYIADDHCILAKYVAGKRIF